MLCVRDTSIGAGLLARHVAPHNRFGRLFRPVKEMVHAAFC